MKILSMLLATSALLLTSNSQAACGDKSELLFEGKSVELCTDKKTHLYVSPDCKEISRCFLTKKINLAFYPNQSPGFSLCYQLGGDAFFGQFKGLKEKIPMCKLNGKFVDQENLMIAYRKQK